MFPGTLEAAGILAARRADSPPQGPLLHSAVASAECAPKCVAEIATSRDERHSWRCTCAGCLLLLQQAQMSSLRGGLCLRWVQLSSLV